MISSIKAVNILASIVVKLVLLNPGYAQTVNVEDLAIKTTDDFRLEAKFFKTGSSKPSPSLLLIHQCDIDRNADKTGFEKLVNEIAKSGINVLIYFQRGYNGSTDVDISRLSNDEIMSRYHGYHRSDAIEVMAYLANRSDVIDSKMAVGGASCGGRHAISIASEYQVDALLLLSVGMNSSYLDKLQRLETPLFFLFSENDPYATKLSQNDLQKTDENLVYKKTNGNAHGWPILDQDDNLIKEISVFFSTHLKN